MAYTAVPTHEATTAAESHTIVCSQAYHLSNRNKTYHQRSNLAIHTIFMTLSLHYEEFVGLDNTGSSLIHCRLVSVGFHFFDSLRYGGQTYSCLGDWVCCSFLSLDSDIASVS